MGEIKSDNKHFKDKIAGIKRDLKTVKVNINKSLEVCFDEIKECKLALQNNTSKQLFCEQHIDALKNENIQLTRFNEDLKKRLNLAEQYSHCNCPEITVPEELNQNLMFLLRKVSTLLSTRHILVLIKSVIFISGYYP